MEGANIFRDPMDLGRVAMPLVRLMRDARLSWADKQEIADVIFHLCRERKDHEKEMEHLRGGMAGQNSTAAGKGE